MKLIITGGRDFEDKVLAVNSFMELIAEINYNVIPTNTITEQKNDTKSIVVRENPFTEIISVGARGAASTPYSSMGDFHVGEFVANFYHIPIKSFITDLDNLGKRADCLPSEYVGNIEMVQYADALLAFWDKKSNGTEHMIKIAKQKGLLVKIINY